MQFGYLDSLLWIVCKNRDQQITAINGFEIPNVTQIQHLRYKLRKPNAFSWQVRKPNANSYECIQRETCVYLTDQIEPPSAVLYTPSSLFYISPCP